MVSTNGVRKVRKANDRGQGNFSWLIARYSFSFSGYQDPEHMGFRDLRVMNHDRIAPGAGFPPHPHKDMEIITYIINVIIVEAGITAYFFIAG